MRTPFYNFSIVILQLLLPIIAPFSTKIKLFYRGRKNQFAKIESDLKNNSNELFWVHCSSVGEFEQGLPVIKLIKKEHPTWKVLITFFSPSGYETIHNKEIDFKYYLPNDTANNARRFISLIKPEMALFIKYEYWYHYLKELKQQQINTYSVSSIFRPTQAFFKWYGGWNRKMLKQFTYFMVQDQASLELLKSIGLNNATLTGDTRFDRVQQLKEDTLRFPEIEKFIKYHKVFIIGSLRPEDDDTIFNFVASNENFKFIIAPHDITENHISKIEASIPSTVRHSNLSNKVDYNVLIIDSIGKLSRLYRLANFAYIGGGFSDGIHNILEPAAYSIPIFFGKNHFKKYKEATDLISLQAAFPVENTTDLIQKLKQLEDPNKLSTVCATIEKYVNSNIGASKKVLHIINQQAT